MKDEDDASSLHDCDVYENHIVYKNGKDLDVVRIDQALECIIETNVICVAIMVEIVFVAMYMRAQHYLGQISSFVKCSHGCWRVT